nr:TIM-barrel domain-containing protein [Bifidobacterium eulemuris]
MDTRAVIQGEHWRIGLITDALVRFEWSDSGVFVDDATQMTMVRDFNEVPQYTVQDRDGWLEIDTASVHISYNRGPFSKEGLYATVKQVPSGNNTWHYGDEQRGNLGGTARTLDNANGRIPLEVGVNSRDGWAIIDDSDANLIREVPAVHGAPNPFGTWVVPKDTHTTDIYLFAYGHRYREAVRDFMRLTGATPLLPRFAFGNWWSRFHRYTESEYCALIERFESERIPFTTAVIDMDWHLVDDVDRQYGTGWTGYTWNRNFFPNPRRFLAWLHEHGMRVTLNIHPKDGIRAYEDQYETMAQAMGIDPSTGEAVQFDLTSPRFMEAYFDRLHHPLEDEGVDFWWIDWQQGGVTRQPGLDPLWGLNHLHYLESARQDGSSYAERNRRPLTFSRYAGPGSHRYPIGFSGDTHMTWESLRFQPEFTATAANIGYGWWSHDIGGHMLGYRDEELEARWYQLGTFSPINRLHSTDSPFSGKEPWNFRLETESAMVHALRLRHALIPYLYTMNWRSARDSEPLVQPLYWHYPQLDEAYQFPDEFLFGSELLVAPIVTPGERCVQMGKADVWLPQGMWFDFFTGRHYVSEPVSGRRMEVWRPLDGMPVFVHAGAIVPLQTESEPLNSVMNPQSLQIMLFPGADGSFTMIEDDGAEEKVAITACTTFTFDERRSELVIGAVKTEKPQVVPQTRQWTVTVRGVADCLDEDSVTVRMDGGEPFAVEASYDPATLAITIALPELPVDRAITVEFPGRLGIAQNPTERDIYTIFRDAQISDDAKRKSYGMVCELGVNAHAALNTINPPLPTPVIHAVDEVLARGYSPQISSI